MDYHTLLEEHKAILCSLQYESGLFSASSKRVATGYDKAWLRDNLYISLALEALGERGNLSKLFDALFSVLLKHEWKIDHAIASKPALAYQYIHPRYHPETFDEYWEVWGNKQNDVIGALLFTLGLFTQKGITLIDSEDKKRIVQKLILYLQTIEYWHDTDSGIWEEWEEIHASSVGACLAGLKKAREIGFEVSDELIQKGEDMLHHELFPRESHDKFCDLALLTLIYPYGLLSSNEARQVLENIEYHFVKDKGVIRYKSDHYYNKNWDNWSEEAEWTFGFSFLSLVYLHVGKREKVEFYLTKALEMVNEKGETPELYFSHSNKHNENSPLAWAEAMLILTLLAYVSERNVH